MIIEHHWLDCALHIPSPNQDERPDETDISLIVIHCISLPPGKYGNNFIDHLFTNQLDPTVHPYFNEIYKFRVSSHILIDRLGNISQYVAFNKRAWHAGQSHYKGRNRCNDFSIGIELEGTETQPYTETQYTALASLIKTLYNHYPRLSRKNITGHSDIAPDRKTDPGQSFSWKKLRELLIA